MNKSTKLYGYRMRGSSRRPGRWMDMVKIQSIAFTKNIKQFFIKQNNIPK